MAAHRPDRAATFSIAARPAATNPGFNNKSSGGYPAMTSSVKAARSLVQVAIDRISDAHAGARSALLDDEHLRAATIAIAAASRSLTSFVVAEPSSLEVLTALDGRPLLKADDVDTLRRWKQLEML